MGVAEAAAEGGGLRARVTGASIWAAGSNVLAQLIRLASNLLLSRLLFPEAFGLMALANAVLQGLEMFADFGVGPAVIQEKDPNPRLLDAAWSLHIARGWVLFGVVLLLTYPMAAWYHEPQLHGLLPAMGVVSVIRGYSSTSQFTLARDLKLRELFYVEIGSQVLALIVSAVTAHLWRSVWALVFGAWIGAITFTVLTYVMEPGHTHHWNWSKEPLAKIAKFGRWVMLSTALTYVLHHGDRLILGTFMTFAQLGLYQIAQVIARAVSQLEQMLEGRILFPVYAEIGRATTPELMRRVRKIRLAMMALVLPPCWVLACAGDWVVRLLWDPRYHGAGWMVQVLSVGAVFNAFRVGPLYLVRDEPWISFAEGVFHAILLFPSMWLAGSLLGPDGLVVAIAGTPLMIYVFNIWMQRRYKVWLPGMDAIGIAASAIVIGAGFLARKHFGW